MRILTPWFVFTTKWGMSWNRPCLITHLHPLPVFTVGVSIGKWAIVRRGWWNKWTDNGKNAA